MPARCVLIARGELPADLFRPVARYRGDEETTWFEKAGNLGQNRIRIRHVLQDFGTDDAVKHGIGKRQPRRISCGDHGAAVVGMRGGWREFEKTVQRGFHFAMRQVQSHHMERDFVPVERVHMPPAATAQIKHPHARVQVAVFEFDSQHAGCGLRSARASA